MQIIARDCPLGIAPYCTQTGLDPRTDFETVGDRLKKGSLAGDSFLNI